MPPILNHTRVTAAGVTPERWAIVLHGIYGTGRNWASLVRRLVDERPEWGVLLPDLRLHGGSVGFEPPHTVAAAAADVEALVDMLDEPVAAVVGHSFGGKVALEYARDRPAGLTQVWVMDSTLELREPSGSAWRIIEAVQSLPDHFPSREGLVEGLVEQGFSAPLGNWMAMNLERGDDGFRWRLDWQGLEALLRDYFRRDLWEVIENPPEGLQIHMVRAVESDSLGAEDIARIERAGAANGRTFLHVLDGGHWINVDNPEGVVTLLANTLP